MLISEENILKDKHTMHVFCKCCLRQVHATNLYRYFLLYKGTEINLLGTYGFSGKSKAILRRKFLARYDLDQ